MSSLDNILKVLTNLDQNNRSTNQVKMYESTDINKKIYANNWDNAKTQETYDPSVKKSDEKLIRWLLNQKLFYTNLKTIITCTETLTSYGTVNNVKIINKNLFLEAIKNAINHAIEHNQSDVPELIKNISVDELMKKFIRLFNYSDTHNSMKKILNFADKPVTNLVNIPNLNGGSKDLSGEYEAYKNTMIIEKDNIKMIGGGNDIWAPGLEKNATSRSKLFSQTLDTIEVELSQHNKKLATNDLTKIKDAINSLAKRESNIYGELNTLQTYAQLLEKYNNDNTSDAGKALNTDTKITSLVSKYFKNVSRADKNSSKISVVLSALINSINL